MDQTNQPEINTQDQMEPVSGKTANKTGPMVAIIAVVLIVIIAALYIFASRTDKTTIPTEDEIVTDIQPVTNTSDDLSSIESDLNISTGGLDEQSF